MADKIQIPFNIKNETEIKRVLTNILTNMITNSESKTLKDLIDENKALILNIIKGAGLEVDGSYKTPENTYYLGSATSLKIADILLDSELKTAENRITQNETNIADLQSRIIDVWDELVFTITDAKLFTSSGLNYDFNKIAIEFPTLSDTTDTYTIFSLTQLPRTYKVGTNLKPEVYWLQEDTGTVVWKLYYRIYFEGQTPPAWTELVANGTKITYSSGSILQVSTFSDIDGTTITDNNAIIDFKVTRDTTDPNDTLAISAYFKSLTVHYQKDKLGTTNVS